MNRTLHTLMLSAAILMAPPLAHADDMLYIAPNPEQDSQAKPMPLGAMIASRIEHSDAEDASQFKAWLAQSDIKGFDMGKGYTIFAVTDNSFDANAHPIEHYIVNDRIGLPAVDGKNFTLTAINGDELRVGRLMGSHVVDGMRVNGVIKNPEGTIYLIGEPRSAFNL